MVAGPWCESLADFQKSLSSMPPNYKSDFTTISDTSLLAVCNTEHLHVWETDSDVDNLFQLTQTITKIRTLAGATQTGVSHGKHGGPGMVIITEVKPGRDNFARVSELLRHITGIDGRMHLENTVCAFNGIVVVRGIDNRCVPAAGKDGGMQYPDSAQKDVKAAVSRINVAIERVFKYDVFSSAFNRKIVWHHGPVVHFLLHWINNTTATLRSSLSGITVQSALSFTSSGVQPSVLGRLNTPSHLQTLEQYGTRLSIPVVFLDNAAQLLTFEYLATYMYFYGYYINTFLPRTLSLPHLHLAQDALVTFAFRLWGACHNKSEGSVVHAVQKQLDHSRARAWARSCVNPASYTREACQAAAEDRQIHHAVQLADSPFEVYSAGLGYLPAFSRLMIGPGVSSPLQYSVATPFQISFAAPNMGHFRASDNTPFRLLLPHPDLPVSTTQTPMNVLDGNAKEAQRTETITARIQGTMMGVLERVRLDKGMPDLKGEERKMWKEVVKAVGKALESCKGRLPKGVEEKVAFVGQKMVGGTWGYALGASGHQAGAQADGVSGMGVMGMGLNAMAGGVGGVNWGGQQGMANQGWGGQQGVGGPNWGGQQGMTDGMETGMGAQGGGMWG